jgi:hypothetical protein
MGEDFSEQAGAIISESVGDFPRNQQRYPNDQQFPVNRHSAKRYFTLQF